MVGLTLFAIIAFHLLNNYFWLKWDTIPSGIGTDWHLIEAIKFQISLKQIFHANYSIIDKLIQAYNMFTAWPNGNSPPLIYLLSSIINLEHFHLFNARFYFNAPFLLMLILSTYFFAQKLFNQKTGLLAAFLIGFYPLICAYSRQFGPDFPLAAMTALCLAVLVYSEHYSKSFYSVLLGVCLGIGALIKLQIVFFLAGPMAYSFFVGLRDYKNKPPKIFLNFLITLLLLISLASCYWSKIFHEMIGDFLWHMFTLFPGYSGPKGVGTLGPREIPVFSMDWITYYAGQLLNIMSGPMFIAFLLSSVKLIKAKEKTKIFLLLCLLPPLLIFTLISVKFSKFILPLTPVAAVITSWAIMTIQSASLRRAVSLGVISYLVVLTSYSSWLGAYQNFENILTLCLEEGVKLYSPDDERDFKFLEQHGIIRKIQKKIDQDGFIKICFTNNAQNSIFPMYDHFQDDVFLKKLAVTEAKKIDDFQDAAYIILTSERLRSNADLSKRYQVALRVWNGNSEAYILERKDIAVQFSNSPHPVYANTHSAPLDRTCNPWGWDFRVEKLFSDIAKAYGKGKPILGFYDPGKDPSVVKELFAKEHYTLGSESRLHFYLKPHSRSFQLVDMRQDPDSFKKRVDFIVSYEKLADAEITNFLKAQFYLIKSYVMPGGSTVYLYARYFTYDGKPTKKLSGELSGEHIKLQLADNTWKVFFKGKEITKKLSIYTSIRAFGKWRDSKNHCIWKVLEINKNELTAVGSTSIPSIQQIWRFKLDGNRIYLNVKMKVRTIMQLEREQTNIMLSSNYARWITEYANGKFPSGFNRDYGGDWDALHIIKTNSADYVGARGDGIRFPTVRFYCTRPREGMQGAVINSDDQFKGRVLQYVIKHSPMHFALPGEYEYFDGYFSIEEHKEPSAA